MSFRKEKKYRLSFSDMASIECQLFKKGMKQLYPMRKINSCYFDNTKMSMFHDSEEGVLPRKKIRIRWYDQGNKYTQETKISSIEGRFKISKKIIDEIKISKIHQKKLVDNIYGDLSPVIIISYERSYFELNNLRLTFDRNISYKNPSKVTKSIFKDEECVMEVKTSAECEDDYIEKIISLPTSRFSKYSRGLLKFKKMI